MPILRATYLSLFLIMVLGLCQAAPAQAQVNNTYFMADQLLQQREYEKAYRLFEKLYKENPGAYIFFEKVTECLINLKRYDEAIGLAEQSEVLKRFPAQANIRLGEIYHIKGDTTQAFKHWDEVLAEHSDNLQVYLSLARTMTDRRAFEKAIEVYKRASALGGNGMQSLSRSPIIQMEMANAYMQAGNYEEAIRKFLNLVRDNPDRIGYVQSTLLRFNDEYLYDVAILELGDFIDTLPADHPAHQSLHQLELWLLLERELYERALVTAKNYEESRSQLSYSLYGLGSRLLSAGKYELAERAFSYYIDNHIPSARYQSMEELANVYIQWADHLGDFNLAYHIRQDSLYNLAYSTLNTILTEVPSYSGANDVLITLSELALDHLHDPATAQRYLTDLSLDTDSTTQAQREYLEGRIKLYRQEYPRARIAFTNASRLERIGSLAEKARYYLALTDFYAGDYEFAKIQLNALERLNTSYFANDAVQLRVWIQEGLQADSTGELIAPFARAVEHFSQGEHLKAVQSLSPLLQNISYHPLADEALLELGTHLVPESAPLTYTLISSYLESWGQYSPLRERLMWEKARIADEIISKNVSIAATDEGDPYAALLPRSGAGGQNVRARLPSSREQLIALYEQILMEYPQGFYASFARNRIQELQKPQT